LRDEADPRPSDPSPGEEVEPPAAPETLSRLGAEPADAGAARGAPPVWPGPGAAGELV